MKKFHLLIAILLVSVVMQAQINTTIKAPRLKVGVVLGGGGAKGASHIGVLKYIEEMGIPVDYVAGTSMGSIIGGFYAMGYTPDELTELISGMDWSEYIGNKINRSMMSEEMRQRNSTLMLQVPFSDESLFDHDPNSKFISQLPSAYVNNSSLVNLFNDLCVGYQEEMDFNDLPIPFACVATDMITGKEVVLRSGSVPTAMRASMAIPGVFSPVTIDDKVLVDGGLVNNFPADVLREMGADIIIGVEVASTKDITANDLRSLPQVFLRLVTNSTSAKRMENREMCDVHIIPDISGYGTLSFTPEAINTLVGRGYQKASEYHDQLLSIKKAVDASAGHPVSKTLRAPHAKNLDKESVLIRAITFNNVNSREGNWLIRKGRLKIGKAYSEADIENAVKIYRGTGCFDEITYQIKECDSIHQNNQLSDAYDLNIDMKYAKPHVFGLGVRYDTEEGAALLLHVGLNEKKFKGSKLNANLKLSYNPKINLTYTYSQPSLANFNLSVDYRNEHFTWLIFDEKYNLHYWQNKVSGYISQFHLLNLSAAVGVSYTHYTFDNFSMEDTFFDSIYFSQNSMFTPFATLTYDNLDDAYFPKHGIFARFTCRYHFNTKGYRKKLLDLGYSFQAPFTPYNGRVTIIPQLYGRYVKYIDYVNMWNWYGGEIAGRHFEEQLPFIGLIGAAISTENASVIRCDLRYNLYGTHYLTAIYNSLVEWSANGISNHIKGAGIKYSYNSLLGPISLTAQWSNGSTGNHYGAYFSFGYTF